MFQARKGLPLEKNSSKKSENPRKMNLSHFSLPEFEEKFSFSRSCLYFIEKVYNIYNKKRFWRFQIRLTDFKTKQKAPKETYMLCNIALRTCWRKASLVGGICSTVFPFFVNSPLLHAFMSFAELVGSYIRMMKRSITDMASSFKSSVEDSLNEKNKTEIYNEEVTAFKRQIQLLMGTLLFSTILSCIS